jgi:hypothetical protein
MQVGQAGCNNGNNLQRCSLFQVVHIAALQHPSIGMLHVAGR